MKYCVLRVVLISCHLLERYRIYVSYYKDIYFDNQFQYNFSVSITISHPKSTRSGSKVDEKSNRSAEFTSSYEFFHNLLR